MEREPAHQCVDATLFSTDFQGEEKQPAMEQLLLLLLKLLLLLLLLHEGRSRKKGAYKRMDNSPTSTKRVGREVGIQFHPPVGVGRRKLRIKVEADGESDEVADEDDDE